MKKKFRINYSRFSDNQTISDIKSKANSLPHIRGGTRTDRALQLAAEELFGWEDSGDRPDKPNVLVVLTYGDTYEGSQPFGQVIPPLDVSHCVLIVFIIVKACLHRQFLSQQLNAIFVALKLQPTAIYRDFSAVCQYRCQYTSIS